MEFNGFEIRTFIGWLFRSVNLFKYLHANFSLETHIISIENFSLETHIISIENFSLETHIIVIENFSLETHIFPLKIFL